MIDEENKSATMTEAPAAATAAPAHAAPAGSAPVEPEDTVFSLPLSHVTHDISDLADNEDEENAVAAPIGAHAADQPTAPEATPTPAHFAEPVAAAINESAAVFAAPEPAAPAFPIAPSSEVAPASTPAPEAGPSPEDGPAPKTPQPAPASESDAVAEPAAQSQSTPAPSHFATPEPIDVSPQDDESTARVSEKRVRYPEGPVSITGTKAADGGTDVAKETGVDESAPVKVAEAGGLY